MPVYTASRNSSLAMDFCQVLLKLKKLTVEAFYRLYFGYALHCATFVFEVAKPYCNNYIGRFDYCAVPLDDNMSASSTPTPPQTAYCQLTTDNRLQSTDKQRSTAEGKVNGQRGSRHLRPQRPPHNKPPPKGGWGVSPLHHRRQEVPVKINQADTTPTLHLRSNRQEKILTLFCALSRKIHVPLPLSTRCLCQHDTLSLPTQHVAFIFEARFNGRQNTPIFIQKHHLSVHYHRSFANRHLASY